MENELNIKYLAKKYKNKDWRKLVDDFNDFNVDYDMVEIVPDDIYKVLICLLGKEQTKEWINSEMWQLENRKPIELVRDSEGVKALKSFIMMLPN